MIVKATIKYVSKYGSWTQLHAFDENENKYVFHMTEKWCNRLPSRFINIRINECGQVDGAWHD